MQQRTNDVYAAHRADIGSPEARTRAAAKLRQICMIEDRRNKHAKKLLPVGGAVVDLGAAPGGWCGVALEMVGRMGVVIAIDLKPIEPMRGVIMVEGDFTDSAVQLQVKKLLLRTREDRKQEQIDAAEPQAELSLQNREFSDRLLGADAIVSDMAPAASGDRTIDHDRLIELGETALGFARSFLVPGGSLVVKTSYGGSEGQLRDDMRNNFEDVAFVKPDASRAGSREVYIVARNFRPNSRENIH